MPALYETCVHDIDTPVDVLIAMQSEQALAAQREQIIAMQSDQARTSGPRRVRMDIRTWKSIERADQDAWDKISDVGKAAILNYATNRAAASNGQSRNRTANSHDIIFEEEPGPAHPAPEVEVSTHQTQARQQKQARFSPNPSLAEHPHNKKSLLQMATSKTSKEETATPKQHDINMLLSQPSKKTQNPVREASSHETYIRRSEHTPYEVNVHELHVADGEDQKMLKTLGLLADSDEETGPAETATVTHPPTERAKRLADQEEISDDDFYDTMRQYKEYTDAIDVSQSLRSSRVPTRTQHQHSTLTDSIPEGPHGHMSGRYKHVQKPSPAKDRIVWEKTTGTYTLQPPEPGFNLQDYLSDQDESDVEQQDMDARIQRATGDLESPRDVHDDTPTGHPERPLIPTDVILSEPRGSGRYVEVLTKDELNRYSKAQLVDLVYGLLLEKATTVDTDTSGLNETQSDATTEVTPRNMLPKGPVEMDQTMPPGHSVAKEGMSHPADPVEKRNASPPGNPIMTLASGVDLPILSTIKTRRQVGASPARHARLPTKESLMTTGATTQGDHATTTEAPSEHRQGATTPTRANVPADPPGTPPEQHDDELSTKSTSRDITAPPSITCLGPSTPTPNGGDDGIAEPEDADDGINNVVDGGNAAGTDDDDGDSVPELMPRSAPDDSSDDDSTVPPSLHRHHEGFVLDVSDPLMQIEWDLPPAAKEAIQATMNDDSSASKSDPTHSEIPPTPQVITTVQDGHSPGNTSDRASSLSTETLTTTPGKDADSSGFVEHESRRTRRNRARKHRKQEAKRLREQKRTESTQRNKAESLRKCDGETRKQAAADTKQENLAVQENLRQEEHAQAALNKVIQETESGGVLGKLGVFGGACSLLSPRKYTPQDSPSTEDDYSPNTTVSVASRHDPDSPYVPESSSDNAVSSGHGASAIDDEHTKNSESTSAASNTQAADFSEAGSA